MQATATQTNPTGQTRPMCSLDRALDDIKHGRVHSWSSAEEMFKTLGI